MKIYIYNSINVYKLILENYREGFDIINLGSFRYNYLKKIEVFILKKAIITGITGQDGAYLAELSPQKGVYRIWNI